jgi:plastocyanin
MKILSGIVVTALIIGAFLWSSPATLAQGNCGNHVIQVEPDGSGGFSMRYRGGSGDSITVCSGDSVSWQLIGSDRSFFVDFKGNAPFSGGAMRGNNIGTLTVTIDAAPGSYYYNFGYDGTGGMDPVIIVER